MINPFSVLSKNKYIVEDFESLSLKKSETAGRAQSAKWDERLYLENSKAPRYGFIPSLIKEASVPNHQGSHFKLTSKPMTATHRRGSGHLPHPSSASRAPSANARNSNAASNQNSSRKTTLTRRVATAAAMRPPLPNNIGPETFFEEKGNKMPPALFKEKKDTLKEYVIRKREIFLSKMNIDLKMKATDKLSDFIQNQEEGLNATISDMRNDAKMVNYFIQKLETDVTNDIATLKKVEKEKNDAHNTFIRIKNETHIIQQQVKNIDEDLKVFEEFKRFILEIAQYASLFGTQLLKEEKDGPNQPKNNMFVTGIEEEVKTRDDRESETKERNEEEDEADEAVSRQLRVIMKHPEEFLDVLRRIEDENLRIIENTQNVSEDLTILENYLEQTKKDYKEKMNELDNNIKEQIKIKEELEREISVRKEMKKIYFTSNNSLKINDSAKGLDPKAMCNKIKEIFNVLFPDKRNTREIRDLDRIEAIENEFEKYQQKEAACLRTNAQEYEDIKSHYQELMKKLGNEKARNRFQVEMEEKKKRQKEKFEKPIVIHKGRKDATRHRIKKGEQKQEDSHIDFDKIENERFCSWTTISPNEQQKYFEDIQKEPFKNQIERKNNSATGKNSENLGKGETEESKERKGDEKESQNEEANHGNEEEKNKEKNES